MPLEVRAVVIPVGQGLGQAEKCVVLELVGDERDLRVGLPGIVRPAEQAHEVQNVPRAGIPEHSLDIPVRTSFLQQHLPLSQVPLHRLVHLRVQGELGEI